jgi:DNA-binding NarL/FixJ family response regulator
VGVIPLTERQLAVAYHVRQGLSNKQIAEKLGVTEKRVKDIVARIAAIWQLDPALSIRAQIVARVCFDEWSRTKGNVS